MGALMVLITGATGAVGPSVVRACHEAGFRIRTFSADQCEGGVLPDDVEALVGDVCDASAVHRATEGADVVVHLAAVLHRFEPTGALTSEYWRVNVEGTRNVVDAAVTAGVKRLVYVSTVSVYGPGRGETMDETTCPEPTTEYGRSKLEAERIVRAAGMDGRAIGSVLRAAAVYGPRVKGNYRRLAEAIACGRFVPVGRGDNRRTLVYETDLAQAVLIAAAHPGAAGRTYNVTDGRVHTLAQIIEAIYRALGRKPPRLHVPLRAARMAIDGQEVLCRMLGRKPRVTRWMLDKYTEDIAVDGSLIQKEVGFRPQVDLRTGWREVVASLHSGRPPESKRVVKRLQSPEPNREQP